MREGTSADDEFTVTPSYTHTQLHPHPATPTPSYTHTHTHEQRCLDGWLHPHPATLKLWSTDKFSFTLDMLMVFFSFPPPPFSLFGSADASTTNGAQGTPAYMAPELFRGMV